MVSIETNNVWPRIIAHADLDAFYASAEQLDDPSLLNLPLVVGPRSKRGVVLTASYEARVFGVRSAMPMAEALQRCPNLVAVPPRFERYQELSQQMMDAFADFSPQVEAISLDEAFIDMSGATEIFGQPDEMARKIKASVQQATGGLTISVGVAATKYVAKVASAFAKPDGLTIVTPEAVVDWLDPMPVSKLWGAGPKTVPRLERIGLYTIGDVRRADSDWLKRMLGSQGLHFQRLASGQDLRPVARRRSGRSMGSDRTLTENVSSTEEIAEHLRRSAERIGSRLRAKGLLACGVRVRLKTRDFKLLSRQCLLPDPSNSSSRLYRSGLELLDKFDENEEYRLVGLAAFDLLHESDPFQPDLFTEDTKKTSLERTIDAVDEKFGSGSNRRGRGSKWLAPQ